MPTATTSAASPASTPAPNPFLLAADASPALLPLLRAHPALARSQDASGYSLLHALASYGHATLLARVASEFAVPADTVDEDGETALFVAETVDVARVLVEDVGVDWRLRSADGLTAEEKIAAEGDFGPVADYLAEVRGRDGGARGEDRPPPPPLPRGVTLTVGTVDEDDEEAEPDPEFRSRIDELAARDDFGGDEGQAQLRDLVRDAVRGVGAGGGDGRDVRRRLG